MTDLFKRLLADNTTVEAIHYKHLLAVPGDQADQGFMRNESLKGALRPQEKLMALLDLQRGLNGAQQVFLFIFSQIDE